MCLNVTVVEVVPPDGTFFTWAACCMSMKLVWKIALTFGFATGSGLKAVLFWGHHQKKKFQNFSWPLSHNIKSFLFRDDKCLCSEVTDLCQIVNIDASQCLTLVFCLSSEIVPFLLAIGLSIKTTLCKRNLFQMFIGKVKRSYDAVEIYFYCEICKEIFNFIIKFITYCCLNEFHEHLK